MTHMITIFTVNFWYYELINNKFSLIANKRIGPNIYVKKCGGFDHRWHIWLIFYTVNFWYYELINNKFSLIANKIIGPNIYVTKLTIDEIRWNIIINQINDVK